MCSPCWTDAGMAQEAGLLLRHAPSPPFVLWPRPEAGLCPRPEAGRGRSRWIRLVQRVGDPTQDATANEQQRKHVPKLEQEAQPLGQDDCAREAEQRGLPRLRSPGAGPSGRNGAVGEAAALACACCSWQASRAPAAAEGARRSPRGRWQRIRGRISSTGGAPHLGVSADCIRGWPAAAPPACWSSPPPGWAGHTRS